MTILVVKRVVRWALVVFHFSFSLIGTCVLIKFVLLKTQECWSSWNAQERSSNGLGGRSLWGEVSNVCDEFPIKCNSHEDQTLSMCVILTHVMLCFLCLWHFNSFDRRISFPKYFHRFGVMFASSCLGYTWSFRVFELEASSFVGIAIRT